MLCLHHIVWINGGYPCGEYSDLKLAREAYVLNVDTGERTWADKGYRDELFFILPHPNKIDVHSRVMARHETINKRMRQFQALQQSFRHDLRKHPIVVNAVANLTQLMLENGEPLFSV